MIELRIVLINCLIICMQIPRILALMLSIGKLTLINCRKLIAKLWKRAVSQILIILKNDGTVRMQLYTNL